MLFTFGLILAAGFGVNYWLNRRAASGESGAKLFGMPARTVIGIAGLLGTFVLPGLLGLVALGAAAGAAVPPIYQKIAGKASPQITTSADVVTPSGEPSFLEDVQKAFGDLKNQLFEPAQA